MSKDVLTTDPVAFDRIVTMSPAFDKRDPDPKKNYGIHGVELRMVLRGPLGATQFLLYTNWQLPHVTQETYDAHYGDRRRIELFTKPMPADKGYHWSTPRYKDQQPMDCDLLPGGKCYYDGSTMNAEPLYEVLLTQGSEGIWRELEAFYHRMAERTDD